MKIEFDTIAFFVYLRGEEAPLIVIEGLNMFWKDTQNRRIPNMMMTLKVRFKGEKNFRWHCVLLADQNKMGYQQEGVLVKYSIVYVNWRIRKGVFVC